MKLDILDAHDRYKKFTGTDFNVSECCQDLIDKRPFGNVPFYIFVHPRTEDDGVTKRIIWQPRLTKPKAQTNSWLFKGYPGKDVVKIIWMIPPREMWDQYKKDHLCESHLVSYSIHQFEHNRADLEAKEDDDLSDEEIDKIYEQLSIEARRDRVRKANMTRPMSLET